MKVTINFCADMDIAKLLQGEKNRSQVINGLLRNYFSENIMDKATPKDAYPNDEPPTSEEEVVLKEVGL